MPANDNIRIAVASIILSVFALSLGDALIKLFSVQFSLWQLYVLRSLIALPLLVVIVRMASGGVSLWPTAPAWTILRSTLLAAMWVAYYIALPHIKLSVAAAVYYTIPLLITLYSAALTGDRVSGRSWFAVALGFAGVLVIVRPTTDGFNGYVLLPLVAANLYALAMILTRTRCRQENARVLSLWLNITFIVVGSVASALLILLKPSTTLQDANAFLLGPWQTLAPIHWAVLAALACIMIAGSVFAAIAYQSGPSSLVATFDYAYLAFSVFWGVVIFAELPDGLTLLGIGMVAIAGLIAVRE